LENLPQSTSRRNPGATAAAAARSFSTFSSMFVVVQLKVKAALPEQKVTFKIASVADQPDQTPKINPSLLRIDLKQNLRVWPNVASDLTRSPPFAAVQSLS
jgi:hypothetical protein